MCKKEPEVEVSCLLWGSRVSGVADEDEEPKRSVQKQR